MNKRSAIRAKLLCISTIAGLCPAITTAQEAGGVRINMSLAQRFETTSNRDLSDAGTGGGQNGTTSLSFGISSETRSELLALNFATALQLSNDASPAFDPEASLSYERSTPDATLTLGASWAQSDVSFLQDAALVSGDIPDDFTDLTGIGTQTTNNLSGSIAWGETDPVGYNIGVAFTNVSYTGANDRLTDVKRATLTGGLRLNIDAITTADVTLRYNKRASSGEPVENTFSLASQLTFSRPNGDTTAGFTAVRDDDDGDVRLSANLGRTFSLPNTTLNAVVGLSETDQTGAVFTGQLNYQYELPTGQINLRAQRAVGPATTTNSVNASYAMNIDPLSNLRFSYDFAKVHDRNTLENVSRNSLSAGYGLSLTEDWQVNLGLRHDQRNELGTRARANTLFLVLERDFSYLR